MLAEGYPAAFRAVRRRALCGLEVAGADRSSLKRWLALATFLVVAGCAPPGQGPLLSGVEAGPPAVSPETRDVRNQLDVRYTLGAPARVWAEIETPGGERLAVHEGVARPVRGTYTLHLDGTTSGPGPNERQVLPDGAYRVLLRAQADGQAQEAAVSLRIRGADTTAPEVQDLQLLPDRISPNFDARDDITRVTYRLAKDARAQAFVDRVRSDGRRERAWTGEERALLAGEQRLQWDGTRSGRPLPDGAYELGIRARDLAGNVREARRPLQLEAGGTPEAKIVSARIAPREVSRGNELCADLQVRNTGQTVLRTQGPDPGYVYSSLDTYSSIEANRYAERAGYWRVGLDFAGTGSTMGARYPYRWGFGRDLAPGDEVSVRGCVRVFNEQDKLVVFAGLVRENVATYDSGSGMVEVRVTP